MTRFKALPISTVYWKPGTDFLREIIEAIRYKVRDCDFVVISEKALSVSMNNIVDESTISPNGNAKFIASFWMRIVWGYFLGILCRFGKRLIQRVRNYPIEAGSRHKQLALNYAGLSQALMFGSEGAIDGSNVPYSYVSLPIGNPEELAKEIRGQIEIRVSKKVTVILVDTDKTYTFWNFHFTPRPNSLAKIHSGGGILAYVLGRMLKTKRRSTPIAVAGNSLSAEEALRIANIADRTRGPGSGATVWDMAARFKVSTSEVTWDMLARLEHKPLVLVRKVD